MATVFKTVRASDVILAPSGGVNSITTRTGFLELKSASSNDVRLAYDLPSNDRSVATKVYVDSVSQGLSVKEAVRARTSAALGAGVTYVTDSGVMTITAAANSAIADAAASFDGIVLVANDRVLFASESGTDRKYHGLYYVTNVGSVSTKWVLKRTTDADNVTITSEVKSGIFTFVSEGTVYAGSGWVLSTANPITVDTTVLVFTQFSGAGALTLANLGGGQGIYASTSGSTLNLNSLAATTGTNASLALEVATAANLITYKFDSSKITTTGALTSGSIDWTGDIKTTGAITASGSNISGVNVTASGILTGDTVSVGAGGSITYSSTTSGINKIIVPNTTADAFSIIGATSNKKYITVNTDTPDMVIFPQSKLDLSTTAGVVKLLGNSATSLSFNGGSNVLTLDTTTGANKVLIPQGIISYDSSSSAALEINGNSASSFSIRNTANTKNYLSVDSSTGNDTVLIPQGKLNFSFTGQSSINFLDNKLLSFRDSSDNNYLEFDGNQKEIYVNVPFYTYSGVTVNVSTISTNQTLDSTQHIVYADSTVSSFTITLPTSTGRDGRLFKIIKINATNVVTIAVQSGDKINSVTNDTIVLYSQSESVSLFASNGSWIIE
jgi:hypothetical protein